VRQLVSIDPQQAERFLEASRSNRRRCPRDLNYSTRTHLYPGILSLSYKNIPRTSGDPLARHLFSIGQDVSLHSSIYVPAASQGVHRIIAILPDGGEEPRYLIKFGAGPAMRVVSQRDVKAHVAESGSAEAVFSQAS
jgi:hypothetical protein